MKHRSEEFEIGFEGRSFRRFARLVSQLAPKGTAFRAFWGRPLATLEYSWAYSRCGLKGPKAAPDVSIFWMLPRFVCNCRRFARCFGNCVVSCNNSFQRTHPPSRHLREWLSGNGRGMWANAAPAGAALKPALCRRLERSSFRPIHKIAFDLFNGKLKGTT